MGHDRPQVRTAKPDVDDVADALAGMPQPSSAADLVGEIRHPVEHGVHFGHYVDAVYQYPLASGATQSNMQYRPLFGHVDLRTVEHGIDVRAQPAFSGQR